MSGLLSKGVARLREDGLAGLRKAAPYLLERVYYSALKPLEPVLLKYVVLSGEELREVSDRYVELTIEIDKDIPQNVIEGRIDLETASPEVVVWEPYDTLPLRRPFVCEVSNVRLKGRSPVGFSEGGKILGETIYFSFEEHHRLASALSQVTPPEVVRCLRKGLARADHDPDVDRIDKGVLMTNRWRHYGHWILDHALKLRYLEQYHTATSEMPNLILESNPPEWKRRYIELLGFGDVPIVEYDGRSLNVDTLVIPSYPEPTRDGYLWLGERVRKNVDETVFRETKSPRKVWLSRKNQDLRRIVNEAEVRELIEEYGFEICRPETMTVDEQIAYFSEVDVLVGPHGSAFANMVLASEDDVIVVELFGKNVKLGFYRMAHVLNFDYQYLLCKPSGDDIMVDIDELEGVLETVVE